MRNSGVTPALDDALLVPSRRCAPTRTIGVCVAAAAEVDQVRSEYRKTGKIAASNPNILVRQLEENRVAHRSAAM